jgi:hypothetical protein
VREIKVRTEVQPIPSFATQHAVRDQLEKILSSQLFRNSKRYPKFLRTVVEYTLNGHVNELKERTIGIEVFGRDPNYDTGLDPVVRVTAGEVRKRIAQYYHEPGHEQELLIDLQPGSYVPEFTVSSSRAFFPEQIQPMPGQLPSKRTQKLGVALFGMLLLIAGGIAVLDWANPWTKTALGRFWSPVLHSPDRVLLCVGPPPRHPNEVPTGQHLNVAPNPWPQDVAFKDAATLSKISGLMRENHKDFSIRTVGETTFSDLQSGPTVLVGAFNNSWTMRLDDILRYRFFMDNPEEPSLVGIMDQRDPKATWIVHLPTPNTYQDYAIVSRIADPRTAKTVVFAAGVRGFGTLAAGRFLTDPQYLRELSDKLPKDWEQKNIEFVLATDVIDGSGGPPRVLASHVW